MFHSSVSSQLELINLSAHSLRTTPWLRCLPSNAAASQGHRSQRWRPFPRLVGVGRRTQDADRVSRGFHQHMQALAASLVPTTQPHLPSQPMLLLEFLTTIPHVTRLAAPLARYHLTATTDPTSPLKASLTPTVSRWHPPHHCPCPQSPSLRSRELASSNSFSARHSIDFRRSLPGAVQYPNGTPSTHGTHSGGGALSSPAEAIKAVHQHQHMVRSSDFGAQRRSSVASEGRPRGGASDTGQGGYLVALAKPCGTHRETPGQALSPVYTIPWVKHGPRWAFGCVGRTGTRQAMRPTRCRRLHVH